MGLSWGDRSGLEREAHQSLGFLTKEETEGFGSGDVKVTQAQR